MSTTPIAQYAILSGPHSCALVNAAWAIGRAELR
jgi:hypothetical protein